MDDIIRFEQSFGIPYAFSPLIQLLIISLAPQKNAPDTKTSIKPEYDYIIVGAGTGGSVVAGRLSEKKCVSVLALEAGTRAPILADIPFTGPFFAGAGSNATYNYFSAPQRHCAFGMNNQSIGLYHAKLIGGGTAINHMVFSRGNYRDYDSWSQQGADGWSYEEVLPYFKKLERDQTTQFDTKYHGYCGPIPLELQRYDSPVRSAVREAFKENNYPFVDSNGRHQAGFFEQRSNMKDSQRFSVAKGYLVPAEKRKNLDVVAEALVTKVIIENKRAIGVKVLFKGEEITVRARREVIVSAGAIRSPQVLMLSGIGPRDHLEENEIPVIADLPVGKNFHDHPWAQVMYEVDVPLESIVDRCVKEENINEYLLKRSGLLACPGGTIAMACLNNGHFNRTSWPDFGVYFLEFLIPMANTVGINGSESYSEYQKRFEKRNIVTCMATVYRPKSRGSVKLRTTNPQDSPLVDLNYYEHPYDRKTISEGLMRCEEIFNSPAMKKIGGRRLELPVPFCKQYQDNLHAYMECIALSLPAQGLHYAGTASMGRTNDPTRVVDPQLRVRGIKGLRVIDGSVMPTVPAAHTMNPIIMLAEKASDMIKKTIHCRRPRN